MDREKMPVELYAIHTGYLDDEIIFRKRLQQVSYQRYEKVNSYKIKEEQKRSLAAGVLLETILKERGYDPKQIEREEGGKLYLPNVDDFYFSIAHSGEYAVCAIADLPVGVDIQQRRNTRSKIARRFFQTAEADHIEGQPEEKREELFFRYWTGKESYLKLTGKGLFGGLDSFMVDMEQSKIIDPYQHQDIFLKEYHCFEDYYISVACYSSDFSTFIKKIYYRL
ncbi:MAG: 4'-phosphopantetheinyl transferase superfamily protein [Lachnospiraceae bacterium]|nr:4'-phosphopantetheinyl transferase superfamily protein [Lachnospiraceae bacterium]